jgi:transcriptional regulator of acetoin/glycerol metabolism
LAHPWPGNIRQLRNVLRTAAALCGDHGRIDITHLPREVGGENQRPVATATIDGADGHGPLRTAERDALLRELERLHWNISRTAKTLGVSRNTLYRKIRKHEIVLPD